MRARFVVAALAMAVSPLSWSAEETKIELKDRSVLVVFEDGKMAMRDARGRTASMEEGQPMETIDGRVITMRGNETLRKTEGEKELDRIYFGGP